nr:MAG TPA: hypothetical protein [Caudoviricetes sp.]
MSSYMMERRSNPALRKDEKKDGTDWQQMLGLMALGQGANAQTMLGFALGKLLREMWDHHLAARRAKQAQPTAEQISKIEHPGGPAAQTPGTPQAQTPQPTRGLLGQTSAGLERAAENMVREAGAATGSPAFSQFLNNDVMGGYTPQPGAGDAWDALVGRQTAGAVAGLPFGAARTALMQAAPGSVWNFGVNTERYLTNPQGTAAAESTASQQGVTDSSGQTTATPVSGGTVVAAAPAQGTPSADAVIQQAADTPASALASAAAGLPQEGVTFGLMPPAWKKNPFSFGG